MTQSGVAVEYTDCISAERWVHTNECPRYDTKKSDSEAPAMLELWGMQSTPSLQSLSSPLYPRVGAPYSVLSMGQIELFDHLTVCKQITDV